MNTSKKNALRVLMCMGVVIVMASCGADTKAADEAKAMEQLKLEETMNALDNESEALDQEMDSLDKEIDELLKDI